jgi:hypothetical protein
MYVLPEADMGLFEPNFNSLGKYIIYNKMVFGFINKAHGHLQTGYKNILKHGTQAKKFFHTVDNHVNNFSRFLQSRITTY